MWCIVSIIALTTLRYSVMWGVRGLMTGVLCPGVYACVFISWGFAMGVISLGSLCQGDHDRVAYVRGASVRVAYATGFTSGGFCAISLRSGGL